MNPRVAALAQLVEHRFRKAGVRCSSHLSGTILSCHLRAFGGLFSVVLPPFEDRNPAMPMTEIFENVQGLIESFEVKLKTFSGEGVDEVVSRLHAQDRSATSVVVPEPKSLPVLNHLDSCLEEAARFDAPIERAISVLRPHLQWLQSKAYNDALLGTGFIENYGWCEIIGPRGFFPGDDFLLGLLMLGPNQHYRDHFHPAPELYWPLTSETEWRKGEESLTPKPCGSVIWHRPNVIHATRTGAAPLLTFWSWTRDTATPARLV